MRCMLRLALKHQGMIRLQCSIGIAEDNLSEIPQTVLYVWSGGSTVDDESDADNIETVKLVDHR